MHAGGPERAAAEGHIGADQPRAGVAHGSPEEDLQIDRRRRHPEEGAALQLAAAGERYQQREKEHRGAEVHDQNQRGQLVEHGQSAEQTLEDHQRQGCSRELALAVASAGDRPDAAGESERNEHDRDGGHLSREMLHPSGPDRSAEDERRGGGHPDRRAPQREDGQRHGEKPHRRGDEPMRMLHGDVAHHRRHDRSIAGGPVGAGEAGVGVGDDPARDDERDGEQCCCGGEAANQCCSGIFLFGSPRLKPGARKAQSLLRRLHGLHYNLARQPPQGAWCSFSPRL